MIAKKYRYAVYFVMVFMAYSCMLNAIKFESNETYVVVNTLKFAGSRSLKPSPFFDYGTLHPYVLLLLYGLIYITGLVFGLYKSTMDFAIQFFVNPQIFYLAGRFLSCLFGVAGGCVLFHLGERYYSRKVGLLATGFMLFNFTYYVRSRLVLPETALVFLCVLYLYFLLAITQENKTINYMLSGIFLGMAFATKINSGIMLIGFPLACLLSQDKINIQAISVKKILVFIGFFLFTVFLTNPYIYLDFGLFLERVNFSRTMVANEIRGQNRLAYLWIFEGFFKENAFMAVTFLIGILYALFKRSKKDIIFLTILLAYFVVNGPLKSHNLYYLLPILPVLAILAANALDTFCNAQIKLLKVVSILLIVSVFLVASNRIVKFLRYQSLPTTDTFAKEWVEKNIPRDAFIAMDSYANGPQIFTVDKYFSASRLQDYRKYLPAKLKKAVEKYAVENNAYRSIRIKFYHPEPVWPDEFSQDIMDKVRDNNFFHRAYRMDYYSLEELQRKGVTHLIISNTIREFDYRKYSKDNLMYHSNQRVMNFYKSLAINNYRIKFVKDFKPANNKVKGHYIRIYKLRS